MRNGVFWWTEGITTMRRAFCQSPFRERAPGLVSRDAEGWFRWVTTSAAIKSAGTVPKSVARDRLQCLGARNRTRGHTDTTARVTPASELPAASQDASRLGASTLLPRVEPVHRDFLEFQVVHAQRAPYPDGRVEGLAVGSVQPTLD